MGLGPVPQLMVQGRAGAGGAGDFRAVCSSGTEGVSRNPGGPHKLCHPLNQADGIF